jgi:hypothetical protein
MISESSDQDGEALRENLSVREELQPPIGGAWVVSESIGGLSQTFKSDKIYKKEKN